MRLPGNMATPRVEGTFIPYGSPTLSASPLFTAPSIPNLSLNHANKFGPRHCHSIMQTVTGGKVHRCPKAAATKHMAADGCSDLEHLTDWNWQVEAIALGCI